MNFPNAGTLAAGMSYKMLTINTLSSGSIELTDTASTFTVGTTLEGTGTVSLTAENNGDKYDTVIYTINAEDDPGDDDPGNDDPGDPDTPAAPAIRTQAQTHSAAMAMSAGTLALNQGADTVSAAGFNLASSGIAGVQAFSSVGGGSARASTGSHVTLHSLNFSVGVGNNIRTDLGLFSIGAAFEAGWGRFKNHYDAGSADPYIKKSGHVRYYGAALVSGFSFDSLWHISGALRGGKMKSSQNNALYDPSSGATYDIDISSFYIGAEFGGGRVIKFDDASSLDLYGRYFFLYQDSDKFSAGGEYKLDSVTSHRLRLAGRYSHEFTRQAALYCGLGAEYEFDGKARFRADNVSGKPSENDGLRGFGEAGITVNPGQSAGLSLDFSVKGLLGKDYRGAWVSAEVKYQF